jgi:hypothetical protein
MTVGIASIVSEGALATQTPATTFVTLSHTTQVTQAGVYRIRAYVSLYGTAPTAADANNVSLKVGATAQVLSVPAVAGSPNSPYTFMVTLDGNTDVTLVTGAGTPVATYSGMLVADFCGSNGQLMKFLPA